ncbi:MAG: IclR family transcriptional regulator [Chloroflexota bacterium]
MEERTVQGVNPNSGIGTLRKAMHILRFFADHGTEWRIRQLAAAVQLPRSTVHRLCQDMVAEGILHFDPKTELYHWGPGLMQIAERVYQRVDVRRIALPVMHDIVRHCDETALLVLYDRERREIMFTDEVECGQPIRYHNPLGIPLPLHAGTSGKAVMAFLPKAEIERIIDNGLRSETDRTVVDPSVLRQQLDEIRARGYVVSHGERTPEAVGLGCPLFDGSGRVIGDLMVTVPEYRFHPELEASVVPMLLDGAERISRLMGLPSTLGYPPHLPEENGSGSGPN